MFLPFEFGYLISANITERFFIFIKKKKDPYKENLKLIKTRLNKLLFENTLVFIINRTFYC